MKTQKTTLNLPENLHAEAKAEAARLRMSLTQLVVQALQRELDRLNLEGQDASVSNQQKWDTLGAEEIRGWMEVW